MAYKKLYIFDVHNLMSSEIRTHLRNYHHSLCHKQIHSLQNFLLPFLLIICVCDIRTLNRRSLQDGKYTI